MKFNKIAAVIAMSMVSAVFAQEAAQPAAPAVETAPVAEAAQPAAPAVEAAPVAEAAQPAAPAVEAAPVAEAALPAEATAAEAAPVAEAAQPAEATAAEAAPVAEAAQPAEATAVEAAPVAEAAQPAETTAVEAAPVAEAAQPAEATATEAAPVAEAAQPAAAPAVEKPAESFTLKGNVQTQVTKSIADEDNNFSSGWIRANIGAQYKSENLDGLIMLRIFATEFGNKIKDGDGKTTAYDKILADLYWANYKWAPSDNDLINLKIGRWKTDWSQSTNFGTYIDKDLTKRGLWMRDYSHNAVELGWKHGFNQLNAMVAAKNGTANQGYIRIEDDLKFSFPLDMKFAYRANLIDVVQNTAALTHRVAAYASFSFAKNLRLYGEYACIYTQDEDINPAVDNYIAPESKYFTAGDYYQPFYVGLEIPTFGILSNLMFEMEYIKDRQEIHNSKNDMDDLAWTVALVKTIGKSKLQLSAYSENEMTDLGLAFRLTTTFK